MFVQAFREKGCKVRLLTFAEKETGRHNAPLPAFGQIADESVRTRELLCQSRAQR
jgi:hypothetical protein